ncbi:head-tail adaptor protein, partial [Pseudomonas syringae]
MRAGRLRHRISLQAMVRKQDPVTGEEQGESWQTVWDKVPAAVEPLSAR